MSKPSSFVCAGVDTVIQLIGNFIDKFEGSVYFTDEQVANYLQNHVDKYLYSFGTGLNYKTKRIPKNHIKRFEAITTKIRNRPFMNGSKQYWDSGGFQIANGALETKTMPEFIDLYYGALVEYEHLMDWSFILDLPPGPNSKNIFKSLAEDKVL